MQQRLRTSLFVMRVSVFLVMAMWSLSKLLNPGDSAEIFENFYSIGGLGSATMYVIGLSQLIIEVLFVLGVARFWTYGFVLLTHAVSTLSSWQQYLHPFDHMLFLAAIPMLAACLALFLLRDWDTLFALGR
jgi:putative oxidoreductase